MQELHDGSVSGHFGGDTTTHKNLHAGYYWPTSFKDTHAHMRKCKVCQASSGRVKIPALPWQLVVIDQPFKQWGLDAISEIVPNLSKKHKFILTTTNLFTKWVEAIPLKTFTSDQVITFIKQNIVAMLGLPNTFLFYTATYFYSPLLILFAVQKSCKIH